MIQLVEKLRQHHAVNNSKSKTKAKKSLAPTRSNTKLNVDTLVSTVVHTPRKPSKEIPRAREKQLKNPLDGDNTSSSSSINSSDNNSAHGEENHRQEHRKSSRTASKEPPLTLWSPSRASVEQTLTAIDVVFQWKTISAHVCHLDTAVKVLIVRRAKTPPEVPPQESVEAPQPPSNPFQEERDSMELMPTTSVDEDMLAWSIVSDENTNEISTTMPGSQRASLRIVQIGDDQMQDDLDLSFHYTIEPVAPSSPTEVYKMRPHTSSQVEIPNQDTDGIKPSRLWTIGGNTLSMGTKKEKCIPFLERKSDQTRWSESTINHEKIRAKEPLLPKLRTKREDSQMKSSARPRQRPHKPPDAQSQAPWTAFDDLEANTDASQGYLTRLQQSQNPLNTQIHAPLHAFHSQKTTANAFTDESSRRQRPLPTQNHTPWTAFHHQTTSANAFAYETSPRHTSQRPFPTQNHATWAALNDKITSANVRSNGSSSGQRYQQPLETSLQKPQTALYDHQTSGNASFCGIISNQQPQKPRDTSLHAPWRAASRDAMAISSSCMYDISPRQRPQKAMSTQIHVPWSSRHDSQIGVNARQPLKTALPPSQFIPTTPCKRTLPDSRTQITKKSIQTFERSPHPPPFKAPDVGNPALAAYIGLLYSTPS
ncbi:hypothetical protein AC1031_006401 [Aphanomyces cochlioides]|nr:hypothetical protein AC1031_006401 [Aphanomyces cochlioides]